MAGTRMSTGVGSNLFQSRLPTSQQARPNRYIPTGTSHQAHPKRHFPADTYQPAHTNRHIPTGASQQAHCRRHTPAGTSQQAPHPRQGVLSPEGRGGGWQRGREGRVRGQHGAVLRKDGASDTCGLNSDNREAKNSYESYVRISAEVLEAPRLGL